MYRRMSGGGVIKKILLAVDLTASTKNLMKHAAQMANQHHADLIILHVVEPLGDLGHAIVHSYLSHESATNLESTGMVDILRELKVKIIDSLSDEHIDGEVNLERISKVEVKTGLPAEVILETAALVEADIIVLGSQTPDSSVFSTLGSVANKVLQNSPLPVYLVPTPLFIGGLERPTQEQLRF